jgi:hypothetical protein
MRQISSIFVLIFIFISGCVSQSGKKPNSTAKIIFDTDLGPDYDDVGALAFLHAMADSGKAVILATVASNKHELVAPSIEIVNTYFGRSDLPIGAPKTAGVPLDLRNIGPIQLSQNIHIPLNQQMMFQMLLMSTEKYSIPNLIKV